MNSSVDSSHEIDLYVGERLRQRRKVMNMSQSDLGEMVGVSLQQIQKYELGVNRIAASKLYELAQALRVPVTYFYEGMDVDNENSEGDDSNKINFKRSRPISIMLVEDSAADEVLTRKALETCKIKNEIRAVHDGIEALHMLRSRGKSTYSHRPDIILLDLNIPKIDGISLLKEIKKDRQLKNIPVIVLTNSVSKQDLVNSYSANASGFICKSFDVNEFNKNIYSVVKYWSKAVVLPSM